MFPSRRQAALGLIAATAAGSAARAGPPPAELPDVPNEDPIEVGASRDLFEHLLAPVTINGQGPFQFLLDTGANGSCISRALVARLMLPAAAGVRVRTVVGNHDRPGVLVDRLQVGDRSRKDVQVAALPLTDSLDGVLGVDWLKGQRLELGFKARSVAITRSRDDVPAKGTVVVAARRRLGQLTIVDADLSGRRISAMIDSGSQMSMCNSALRDLLIETNGRKGIVTTSQRIRLESLVGETFWGEMLYLPFMRLGGLQMGNVPVVCSDAQIFELWGLQGKPAVALGMDLLTQFDSVALDFGRSQVRFDGAESQPALPNFKPV